MSYNMAASGKNNGPENDDDKTTKYPHFIGFKLHSEREDNIEPSVKAVCMNDLPNRIDSTLEEPRIRKESRIEEPRSRRESRLDESRRKENRLEERKYSFEEEPRADDVDMPDINVYQQRKTVAQGMMDIALFTANATQLKYSIRQRNESTMNMVCLVFISLSLVLQVVVGVGLIWNSRYNVSKKSEIRTANTANNLTIVGIFLITLVNIFIATFSVQPPETVLAIAQAP